MCMYVCVYFFSLWKIAPSRCKLIENTFIWVLWRPFSSGSSTLESNTGYILQPLWKQVHPRTLAFVSSQLQVPVVPSPGWGIWQFLQFLSAPTVKWSLFPVPSPVVSSGRCPVFPDQCWQMFQTFCFLFWLSVDIAFHSDPVSDHSHPLELRMERSFGFSGGKNNIFCSLH